MIRNIDLIKTLIDKEFKAAVKEHGHSPTVGDALSLAREELEETTEEIAAAMSVYDRAWAAYRADDYVPMMCEAKGLIKACEFIIGEAVQTAAMAKKLYHAANVAAIAEDLRSKRC